MNTKFGFKFSPLRFILTAKKFEISIANFYQVTIATLIQKFASDKQ